MFVFLSVGERTRNAILPHPFWFNLHLQVMNIDTDVVRAESHVEIAQLLERDADTIVELWCMRALEEQSAAKRAHHDVLRDHLPKFLHAMAVALRHAGSSAE